MHATTHNELILLIKINFDNFFFSSSQNFEENSWKPYEDIECTMHLSLAKRYVQYRYTCSVSSNCTTAKIIWWCIWCMVILLCDQLNIRINRESNNIELVISGLYEIFLCSILSALLSPQSISLNALLLNYKSTTCAMRMRLNEMHCNIFMNADSANH